MFHRLYSSYLVDYRLGIEFVFPCLAGYVHDTYDLRILEDFPLLIAEDATFHELEEQ